MCDLQLYLLLLDTCSLGHHGLPHWRAWANVPLSSIINIAIAALFSILIAVLATYISSSQPRPIFFYRHIIDTRHNALAPFFFLFFFFEFSWFCGEAGQAHLSPTYKLSFVHYRCCKCFCSVFIFFFPSPCSKERHPTSSVEYSTSSVYISHRWLPWSVLPLCACMCVHLQFWLGKGVEVLMAVSRWWPWWWPCRTCVSVACTRMSGGL